MYLKNWHFPKYNIWTYFKNFRKTKNVKNLFAFWNYWNMYIIIFSVLYKCSCCHWLYVDVATLELQKHFSWFVGILYFHTKYNFCFNSGFSSLPDTFILKNKRKNRNLIFIFLLLWFVFGCIWVVQSSILVFVIYWIFISQFSLTTYLLD